MLLNFAMATGQTACDVKISECCREKGLNLHNRSFSYSLPNLHKSSLPLKLGICRCSHVPEFIKLKNLLPKSPDFIPMDYSV